MEDLKNKIQESRKIKDNSLKLYLTNLKKLDPEGELKSLDFLKKKMKLLTQLKISL